MEVRTNVDGVEAGTGIRGYIEFWPNKYVPQNGDQIEGASDEVYDFGDSPSDPREGYGSMQIHNPSARQTVLAVNRWWDGAGATRWNEEQDEVVGRYAEYLIDALGLVSVLGYRSVEAVVGHDYGLPVAAWCTLIRPDAFRSDVLMSAPFSSSSRPEPIGDIDR